VVNRVHPEIGDEVEVKPRQIHKLETGDDTARLLAKLLDNHTAFMRVVHLEEQNLAALARKIPRHRWARVPYLEREAVDFPGLIAISEQLFDVG
jgi:hypothetical protein